MFIYYKEKDAGFRRMNLAPFEKTRELEMELLALGFEEPMGKEEVNAANNAKWKAAFRPLLVEKSSEEGSLRVGAKATA